ncbi:MAG TPA: P-loop NTPase fold protein [Candidatus Dormibacteraeota bacterium]|nr:P-loop NTPase fold protein [Candidatus Dormibacteraeota bacterium]
MSEAPQGSAQPYRDAFLGMLRGGGTVSNSSSAAANSGFIVVARKTRSLQELQAICTTDEAPQDCLTARYRVSSGPALGTLIAAFASDLLGIAEFPPSGSPPPTLAGEFQPAWGPVVTQTSWGGLVARRDWTERVRALKATGSLEASWITEFFTELGLGVGSSPPTKGQLVLFAEIEQPGDIRAWATVAASLLPALPSRVGIVIAGAPPDFQVSSDALATNRYLDLDVPDVPPLEEGFLRYAETALSGDQPAKRDRLNIGRYAAALSRLVLLPDTNPLTIGIHGPWGSGKSSFMELVRQELIKQAAGEVAPELGTALESLEREFQAKEHELLTTDEVRQDALGVELAVLDDRRQRLLADMEITAHRQLITVLFNAWRYENATQIWAGLAATVTSRLEGVIPWWARLWARAVYAARLRGAVFWWGFVAPVLATAIVALLLLVTGLGLRPQVGGRLPDWLAWLSAVVPLAPVAVGLAVIVWRFYLLAKPLATRVAEYVSPRSYRDQLGFQHQVLADLEFIRTAVTKRFYPGKPSVATRLRAPRVVVFIDDLDRCSQDHIMEILQAINLILGASDFFVFLGIDTDMIYRAIADHYHLAAGDRESDRFSESYLRKIIQLSFHLPATSPEARFDFVSQMFSAQARSEYQRQGVGGAGAAGHSDDRGPLGFDRSLIMRTRTLVPKNVKDTQEELQAFADFKVFIKGNPRELKRLINVHRLTKVLLQRSEVPMTAPRQRALVEWLVFCAQWPDLVDDVMRCARDAPPATDAIRRLIETCDVGSTASDLDGFCRLMGPDGVIHSADLLEGADLDLAQAAAISQIVRDRPVPPRVSAEAAPDSAPQPEAEVPALPGQSKEIVRDELVGPAAASGNDSVPRRGAIVVTSRPPPTIGPQENW